MPARCARRWYRAPRAPLPPEPGRLQTNALLSVARQARGCRTQGDDRLETRAYAVKRLLWRWGHAQRSGHYACSIGQLVEGLAPVMGWGKRPAGRAARTRWIRAHAKNVRRWLDDLQAAGIISYRGERDNRGQHWRTLITLHVASDAPPDELHAAQRRMTAWRRRRRVAARRARTGRRRGQRLEVVRQASQQPRPATRRRLAIERPQARRRCSGDDQLTVCAPTKLRTHHFVAPATPENNTELSTPATEIRDVYGDRTGVTHARAVDTANPSSAISVSQTASLTAVEPEARVGIDLHDVAALHERVAARLAARQPVLDLIASQAATRAEEVATWTLGRGWPMGRIREAWGVWRHGEMCVAEFGAAAAARRLQPDDGERLRRAATRYERYSAARPTGFPELGLAALAEIAIVADQRDARPLRLHYGIRVLDQLSRRMRAAATSDDAARRNRQAARARRRLSAPPGTLRWNFRLAPSPWPPWVALNDTSDPLIINGQLVISDCDGLAVAPGRTDPWYLQTLRDALLLAGLWLAPEVDGRSAMTLDSQYDVEMRQRRARPGPYAPPRLDGACDKILRQNPRQTGP